MGTTYINLIDEAKRCQRQAAYWFRQSRIMIEMGHFNVATVCQRFAASHSKTARQILNIE